MILTILMMILHSKLFNFVVIKLFNMVVCFSSTRDQDNSGLKRKPTETLEDSDITFKQRKLPTYISITSNVEDQQISEDLTNQSSGKYL